MAKSEFVFDPDLDYVAELREALLGVEEKAAASFNAMLDGMSREEHYKFNDSQLAELWLKRNAITYRYLRKLAATHPGRVAAKKAKHTQR